MFCIDVQNANGRKREKTMDDMTDREFAKYLLETLAPDLREAGQTATADDVEDAGHRLLHAAEIVHTLIDR